MCGGGLPLSYTRNTDQVKELVPDIKSLKACLVVDMVAKCKKDGVDLAALEQFRQKLEQQHAQPVETLPVTKAAPSVSPNNVSRIYAPCTISIVAFCMRAPMPSFTRVSLCSFYCRARLLLHHRHISRKHLLCSQLQPPVLLCCRRLSSV